MPLSYKTLFIDVGHGTTRLREYEAPEILGPIDLGVKLHLEEYESWREDVFSPRNIMVIGRGVFAGGRILGAHRLIAVFRSPLSRGLHVSAMGGAAYKFMGCGVHAVVIEGRSHDPAVVLVKAGEDGAPEARVERIDEERLWDIYSGYKGYTGVKALHRYLYEEFTEYFTEYNARVIAVGPAALRTVYGALVSYDMTPRGDFKPGGPDTAARGGPGSVLYHAHGVVAVIAGGKYRPSRDNPRLLDTQLLDKLTEKAMGKKYTEAVLSVTKKYRYDPRLGTGGTFGVNYVHYRDLIPVFAYNMIYYTRPLRLKIHRMIIEKFWKPFQKEVFEAPRKPWHTCGEPCPVACKKVWRGVKADYEPFNGMGPLIGVLRLEDAARLVELVDSLGYDAIEAGHLIAWLFDLLHRGLLQPRELGLGERPYMDPLAYTPDLHSPHNAGLAAELLKAVVERRGDILDTLARKGLRATAKKLDKEYGYRVKASGTRFEDTAVYAAYGEEGYMTPNYYWTPGLLAPLYILGRYWTNYTPVFMEPEDYAETALQRALHEYLIDNAGFCRFHRGWAGKILQDLYHEIWGVEVDLEKHALQVYRKIAEYQHKAGAEPRPWEPRKVVDMIASLAEQMGAKEWAEKLAENPEAAKEWWERFRKRIAEKLGLQEQ